MGMELNGTDAEFEVLVEQLNDTEQLLAYKKHYDNYTVSFLPRILGRFLVWCGNTVYGHEPSYLKFRAVEVIARVPYHSWASAAFTLLTLFYSDEKRALKLATITKFVRLAADNETMHVVAVSHLAKKEGHAGVIRHTAIPMLFAFFYYWVSYALYLIKPRWSLELNYLFEQHAFDQYARFLEKHGDELKKKSVECEYIIWYGRHPLSQFEFFQSVRNDELVHRNRSIHEIELNESV
ncbi:MAG TPA: alternative oxidase [Candidatus Paceibacterota bacterium]